MSDRLNSTERVDIERLAISAPLAHYELYAQAERMRAEHTARMIGRGLAWLRSRIARLTAPLRNARLARELAALDDKTLADIGLHRSDLAAIAAGKDPRDGTRYAARRPEAAKLQAVKPEAVKPEAVEPEAAKPTGEREKVAA